MKTGCYLCEKQKEGSFFCDKCLKDMIAGAVKSEEKEMVKATCDEIEKRLREQFDKDNTKNGAYVDTEEMLGLMPYQIAKIIKEVRDK